METDSIRAWLKSECDAGRNYAEAQSALWFVEGVTHRLLPPVVEWLRKIAEGEGPHALLARAALDIHTERCPADSVALQWVHTRKLGGNRG